MEVPTRYIDSKKSTINVYSKRNKTAKNIMVNNA